MNAAEELRAAAEKLRGDAEAAHRASPAPWAVTDERVVRCADGMIVADRSGTDHPAERADLPYIAAMSPAVGLALAEWLEHQTEIASTAHLYAEREPCGWCGSPAEHHALAVARALAARPTPDQPKDNTP